MKDYDEIIKTFIIAILTAFVTMTVIGILLKLFLPESPEENPWFILFYVANWLFSSVVGIIRGRIYWNHNKN